MPYASVSKVLFVTVPQCSEVMLFSTAACCHWAARCQLPCSLNIGQWLQGNICMLIA